VVGPLNQEPGTRTAVKGKVDPFPASVETGVSFPAELFQTGVG